MNDILNVLQSLQVNMLYFLGRIAYSTSFLRWVVFLEEPGEGGIPTEVD